MTCKCCKCCFSKDKYAANKALRNLLDNENIVKKEDRARMYDFFWYNADAIYNIIQLWK